MFEQLFRHYYGLLCGYAKGIVNDADEAEDVVQQTMITIWEKRNALQITVSLKSYLYRAVHNAALNKIRSQNVRLAYAGEQLHVETAVVSTTADALSGKELGKQINEAINQLPEQCRMVFKLSRFNELKYAEIADHLGISVKTVENHMGKALKLLRIHLKDFLIWIVITWYLFQQ